MLKWAAKLSTEKLNVEKAGVLNLEDEMVPTCLKHSSLSLTQLN